jgi:hypothetical protein
MLKEFVMSNKKPEWIKGYKEVRNYIHNEEGITREELTEIIKKIVKDEVQEVIGQNGIFIYQAVKEIIRQEMVEAMSAQPGYQHYTYRKEKSFKDFIAKTIKDEIAEALKSQFEIKLDIEKK